MAVQSGLSGRLSAVRPALSAAVGSPTGLAVAIGLALAGALFQAIFGWTLVAADAAFWVDPPGEIAGPLAAAEAILRAPWGFPLTAAYGLARPEATLAIEAGAAPWLIVGVKALGLQGLVNTLGLQLALGWLLQPVAMIVLLRAIGVRRLSLLAVGAALSLLAPSWLAPQLNGPTASGHFVVILALALAITSARHGLTPGRVLMFCALIAAAMGLFTSHAASVAVLFVAAAGSEIAQRRPHAWPTAGGGALRVGLAAAAAAFAFSGGVDGRVLSPDTASPIYPGLGVLTAVSAAAIFWTRVRPPVTSDVWRRFGPLLAALVGLALWAAVEARLSGGLPGRFRIETLHLEAPTYAAIALALLGLERWWRPRWTPAILAAALILQFADVGGLLNLLRSRFAWPAGQDLRALQSPALAGRAWVLLPPCRPGAKDLALMDRLSLIAVRGGGVARTEDGCAPHAAVRAPAAPQDPRIVVTVVGSGDPAVVRRPDCHRLGELLGCGRGLMRPAPELRAPYVVEFTGGRPSGLGAGWSTPEPNGVWSAGKLTGLILLTPVYAPQGLTLEFEAYGYRPLGRATQRITVSHENARITRWEVTDTPGVYRLDVPPGVARPGQVFTLEFFIPDAVPVSAIIPGSSDTRELGLNLQRVRISPLKPSA